MISRAGKSASPMRSVWTVKEVLDWTTDYFRRGGIDTSRFEAELLLAFAISTDRLNLYIDPNRILTSQERQRFRELVKQRHSGTPSAYLLGEVQFMDLTLKVDEAVLIPRPETEELVECILKETSSLDNSERTLSFLDLGTGSGAIILSLLKALPHASGTAADISPAALDVARANAALNGLEERVEFVESDWLASIEGRFDLIVSNPPYIPTAELSSLSDEVIGHEPVSALDGGPKGTRDIGRIVEESPGYLVPGGRLYMEIGFDQGDLVSEIFDRSEHFSNLEIIPDMAGRDRIVRAICGEI